MLASNVRLISHWSESRGVYDDICYLRQAHLFQRFGWHGLDTSLAHETDGYLAAKLRSIDFPNWNEPTRAPCHMQTADGSKWVMTPPPGTGFVLALFPEGFQVVPLYVAANVIIAGFALYGLWRARERVSLTLAAVFGALSIYFMINPTKASYSMAPTMIVCALTGLFTARLFLDESGRRLLMVAAVGVLLGLSASFRIANVFLSAGYFLFFGLSFLTWRTRETFLSGLTLGLAFLVGLLPVFAANLVNSGNPLVSAYGGPDTAPPSSGSRRTAGLSARHAVSVDRDRRCRDRAVVAFRKPFRCQETCTAGRRQSRTESGVLCDTSGVHAVLHHAYPDAVVVDAVVCPAASAGRGARGCIDPARAGQSGSAAAMTSAQPRIAVLVPCYNEEAAVATVVADFRKALPAAEIYVYDNNSRDGTAAVAREAGAIVRSERRQGKGHVVRRMFADVEADIYVLVDGDATYDAPSAPRMIDKLLDEHLDMVVGFRIDQSQAAYRLGHRTGNRMLTDFLSSTFGQEFKDILSGYRVFSRRFVKSFPVLSDGFEIETELAVYALELSLPVAEVETPYYARPEGSFSKLNTWRDGFRIFGTMLKLYRSERPLRFFTVIGILLALAAIILAIPIVVTFIETGLVPRLPTAVLSMGLTIVAILSVSSGIVLDTVTRGRREMKMLAYLSQPAPKRT